MKNLKVVLAILILAFIGIVFFQNQEFFMAKHRINLNLWVMEPYVTPEIYIALLFLISFVSGLLIAYFFGLFEHFRKSKTIKQLTANVNSQQREISALKSELEAAKAALVDGRSYAGTASAAAPPSESDAEEASEKVG